MIEPEHKQPEAEAADEIESDDEDFDPEATTPDGPAEDGEGPLKERVARLEKELEARTDETLRLRADMENLRRRTEREVETARKFALERFMNDLLEVRDSLERGLEAAGSEQASVEQLREGKELTFRMLEKVLAQHGLAVIDPEGEAFNPDLHEAISMVPSEEHDPNTVVTVVQKGFTLHGRLLRPARVVVSREAT